MVYFNRELLKTYNIPSFIAQSAGTVKYTDCTSAER